MKLKGRAIRTQQQQHEDCRVWLDTAELKRKPMQTVLPNSSSIRFHPFSRRKPFEPAAFDFTQTKTPQPCTKQTSMHCYFTQAGIKTEVQNKQCKRKDYVPAVTASVHQKDIKELDTINYLSDSVCPQECSGSLVFMKNTASMNLPAEEQESLDSHKRHADMEQPVTTAKYGSDVMLENSFPPETSSLNQDSIHERGNVVRITYSCPTSCRDVEKTRNAPCTVLDSPFKWCSSEESDREQDDLYHSVATSQLFTQDSQGNRVISHYRKKKYLSVPLQDMTNKCQDILNTPSDSLSCNDDSLQRMFTQDSEGNVVIKH